MMEIDKVKSVYIVGIKGVAMANIAVILKKMGKQVSGSDVDDSFITDQELEQNGIQVQVGFDSLPMDIDLVLYSASHKGSQNPQVVEANKRGIQVMHQAQFLGELLKLFEVSVAVCGTHGKTTTSSFLAHALIKLGQNPSYLVGTSSFGDYNGADYKENNFFVIEADEYGISPPNDKRPKFHFLHPDYIICTSIDLDHTDVYGSIEEVKKSFKIFFEEAMKNGKQIIVNYDDSNIRNIIDSFPSELTDYHVVTYGATARDFQLSHIQVTPEGTKFRMTDSDGPTTFSLPLFGKMNAYNAAAVIILLFMLKFQDQKIRDSINDFEGAKRRFEKVYEQNDIALFDDYAHHPAEIESIIEAARSRFAGRRIVILFQPHTYSRTQSLEKEFMKSWAMADLTFVAPIFASAREKSIDFQLTSQDPKVVICTSKEDVMDKLKEVVRKGDVVFTMGAGDIYKLADDIIRVIASL